MASDLSAQTGSGEQEEDVMILSEIDEGDAEDEPDKTLEEEQAMLKGGGEGVGHRRRAQLSSLLNPKIRHASSSSSSSSNKN